MTLGIDASNIRQGGGVTHLRELIEGFSKCKGEFSRVLVFAPDTTLARIPDFPWLVKRSSWFLNKNLLTRFFWQWIILPRACKRQLSILFNPGGSFVGGFHPYVSMSQNMLVFDRNERARYGKSLVRLRLSFLNFLQSLSFKNADGVLFISEYARQVISSAVNCRHYKVIPHGISDRFRQVPRQQKPIEDYTRTRPFIILYVSIIDVYKHQWQVAKAVRRLRDDDNLPVELHFVGADYPPSLHKLRKALYEISGYEKYIKLHGEVQYDKIDTVYKECDLFVFASTCENMPNIVIEAMAAGLPISSSSAPPMPEFLQDGAEYFNAESEESIYESLKRLILQPALRSHIAEKAFESSKHYSWDRCASDTLNYLQAVVKMTAN